MEMNIETKALGAQSLGATALNWDQSPPRLYISTKSSDFDQNSMSNFKDEGFHVTFLPFNGKAHKTQYVDHLNQIGSSLGVEEKFALVGLTHPGTTTVREPSLTRVYRIGYGDAAAAILETCVKPISRLSTVVAYYPTELPKASAVYPSSLHVVLHQAGAQDAAVQCKSYRYPHAEVGFAEANLDTYDKVSAGIAWSRTLAAVRQTFDMQVDLEEVWETHLSCKIVLCWPPVDELYTEIYTSRILVKGRRRHNEDHGF